MPRVTRQALKRYYRSSSPWSRLLVVPEHNLLYVKNPKAACSTILLWLDRMHTGEHDFTPERSIHKEHRLPLPPAIAKREVLDMLGGAAYRFTFVRDPLRRFESAYIDKLVAKRYGRAGIRATLGLPEDPAAAVSFEEFLAAVELQDPLDGMDLHWRPQHLNLMHPVVEYDHIGKLETFGTDLARICEEAKLPEVPLQVRNARNRGDRDSVYDGRPDLVRRVQAIYATDFEVYGY